MHLSETVQNTETTVFDLTFFIVKIRTSFNISIFNNFVMTPNISILLQMENNYFGRSKNKTLTV